MNKKIAIAAVILLSVSSVSALSLTCPQPSTFKYVHGQWVAPRGWYFDPMPEGGKGDAVGSLIEVEWLKLQSMSVGGIDFCKYRWKNRNDLSPMKVQWDGNPMFVKLRNPSVWRTSDAKYYTCKSSIQSCSFIEPAF